MHISKFRLRAWLLAGALTTGLLAGCNGDGNVTAGSGVKNVILIIGDGFQLEHERAYNNFATGIYDSGLQHWNWPYKGAVATWDVTTYNRYAYSAGAAVITDDKFDPMNTASFNAALGYDVSKGGALPYPQSTLAALNSTAALGYFGTPLKGSTSGSAGIPATDSASAGTALATGFKTDDGNIAWRTGDKADGSLKTIAEMFRAQRGGAIGVVSTVPFTHATPAAFVSHNISRSNYKAIGKEIITSVKPDVVIGGGHPAFNSASVNPDYTYIDSTDYAALKSSGDYILVERQAGVDGGAALVAKAGEAGGGGKKLFGLFGGVGGSFEYHVPSSDGTASVTRGSTENPSLAQAATAAMTVLGKNPNGFFLMIEQGDIDWANHANNHQGMIGGMWDLDQTVRAVEAFIDRPGDAIDWNNTVVIVTSDHGNSFMRIDPSRKLAKGKLPLQQGKPAGSSYGGDNLYPNAEITYGFNGNGINAHTNEPVTLYARGSADIAALFKAYEGIWYPGSKLIDNTQLFRVMLGALGLTDENRK